MTGLIVDGDTLGMMLLLQNPELDSNERLGVKRKIEDRIAQIKAGVGKFPHLDQQLQSAFQDNLRVREDFDQSNKPLIIERFTPHLGCWLKVMDWPHDQIGNPWTIGQVIELMHKSDMRNWASPADYLAYKREQAAKVRKANDDRATAAILDAVDKLGPERLKNFADVERALVTGDTIHFHGEDLRSVERLAASSKRHERMVYEGSQKGLEASRKLDLNFLGVDDAGQPILTDNKDAKFVPATSTNPGHHPKLNKRGE